MQVMGAGSIPALIFDKYAVQNPSSKKFLIARCTATGNRSGFIDIKNQTGTATRYQVPVGKTFVIEMIILQVYNNQSLEAKPAYQATDFGFASGAAFTSPTYLAGASSTYSVCQIPAVAGTIEAFIYGGSIPASQYPVVDMVNGNAEGNCILIGSEV